MTFEKVKDAIKVKSFWDNGDCESYKVIGGLQYLSKYLLKSKYKRRYDDSKSSRITRADVNSALKVITVCTDLTGISKKRRIYNLRDDFNEKEIKQLKEKYTKFENDKRWMKEDTEKVFVVYLQFSSEYEPIYLCDIKTPIKLTDEMLADYIAREIYLNT